MAIIQYHSNPAIRAAQESHYRLVKASPTISTWTDRDPEKFESVLKMLTRMRNDMPNRAGITANDQKLFELHDFLDKIRRRGERTPPHYILDYDAGAETFLATAIKLHEYYESLAASVAKDEQSSPDVEATMKKSPVVDVADALRHSPNALNLQTFLSAVAAVVGRFASSAKQYFETAKEHHIQPMDVEATYYLKQLCDMVALLQKSYVSLYTTGNSGDNSLGTNISNITELVTQMDEQTAVLDEEHKRIIDTTQNLTDANNAFDEFFTTLRTHAESVKE